jgi:hypothetical protein
VAAENNHTVVLPFPTDLVTRILAIIKDEQVGALKLSVKQTDVYQREHAEKK